ncbi:F-box protein CPR1-like [Silene latifolia]|uniref:F-box protein CPR1-like n=1 Tax=Silene latifolia TaxID=37657 RepID=UPI003D773CCD
MCYCLDDEFNADFKVVRFINYEDSRINMLRKVDVYSLKTNLWRTITCETTTGHLMNSPVLVQNHLLVMIIYDSYCRLTGIGCFDIKAEQWSNDVLLPDTILGEINSNSSRYDHYLGMLDGKLRFSWYDDNKATYTTWVMKDYGVKASWVKLMSHPVEQGRPRWVYHPIAYRKGSSHELLCISTYAGKYFWYNLKDKQFTETEFDSLGLDTNDLSYACICKGSLLNFPGCQPIYSASNE